MPTASHESLGDLHETLANTMIKQLKDPAGLTAADLSVMRQFLKDNNITATGPRAAVTNLGASTPALPFGAVEDPEDVHHAPLRIAK